MTAQIFPYVVPEEYVAPTGVVEQDWVRSLGHGVYAVLAEDHDGLCEMGRAVHGRIIERGVAPVDAFEEAIGNLDCFARSRVIRPAMVSAEGLRLVVWEGHWLAATCLLLPRLHEVFSKALGVDVLCASIPCRDSLYLFDPARRSALERFRTRAVGPLAERRKPITDEFFLVTSQGIEPL